MADIHGAFIAVISVTVVLGIMIFVHEWGHFVAAKICGVRVDVFSLGFGTRLWGFKRGDTDYRVSALPFGGYVRMAGDNPLEQRTGERYEFLSQPRWNRFFIAVAGPTMNILLAFFVFWGIFWLGGIPTPTYLRQAPVVSAVEHSPANPSGIQPGDMIVSVNGVKTPTWRKVDTVTGKLQPGEAVAIEISRNGLLQTLNTTVPSKLNVDELVGYPLVPAVADEIAIGYPAEKAGLKSGDEFLSINGEKIVTWPQMVDAVRKSDGRPLNLVVRRDGKELPFTITPIHGMDPDGQMVWQIGLSAKISSDYDRMPFWESAGQSASATVAGCRQIVDVIGGLFTGKVSVSQLQGVVGIARESGRAAERGPEDLLTLMAIISLNLGLLNLLPIPILDGGHVLLLAIEGLIRRDLSIAFKERFVQVGLVFLLGITAFVMYSDILKLIQGHH
ncbi:MAG TPA: RIP metalloprotease RseP [Candidatus Acidoferrum sp.]|nr:RIP metalloprotease RseP [Candidatus Acidoferrum sp.]